MTSLNDKTEHQDRDNPHTRICIYGAAHDVGNLGVRALTHSLIHLALDAQPGARVTLMASRNAPGRLTVTHKGREVDVDIVNFRYSPKSHPSQHIVLILFLIAIYRILPLGFVRRAIERFCPYIDALAHAQFVGDIRGGDSFSDIYGLSRLIKLNLPILSIWMMGKPYTMLPQTCGPFSSRISRMIGRWTILGAEKVYSRDLESLAYARELAGTEAFKAKSVLCPDVAFTLPVEPFAPLPIEPPLPQRGDEIVVGVNVSGLLYNGGYNGENMFNLKFHYPSMIHCVVRDLLAHPGTRILLVPHVFSDGIECDLTACRRMREALTIRECQRVHVATGPVDQSRIKHVVSQCDFFVGSRMHATIAALSQGIPAVGIAYSRKFKGVFRFVDAEELVLDACELSQAEIVSGTGRLFARREEFRKRIGERLADIKHTVARELGGALRGNSPSEPASGNLDEISGLAPARCEEL